MENYLEYYYKKHPESQLQDYVKFIHQMVFGSAHMVNSHADSLRKLKEETVNLKSIIYEDLYEYVGSEFVRINLRPYINYGLNLNTLIENFVESANMYLTEEKNITNELSVLKKILVEKQWNESIIDSFLKDYQDMGYPPLHHSEIYREIYQPSYRLIHQKFLSEELRYYQVRHYLNSFPKDQLNILALDGKCCSGKTTIATLLEKENDVTIIHVDDFFDKSSSEFGINSQRLIKEVFNTIALHKPLTYNKWDCTNKRYQSILINNVKPLVIVEGVYSSNLELIDRYQGIIYLNVDDHNQMHRLQFRSKNLISRFISEWIPRENNYFKKYNIIQKANLIV